MQEKGMYKPFPNIPHGHFEGETRASLPDARTTTLLSPIDKSVLQDPNLLAAVNSGRLVFPFENPSADAYLDSASLIANWVLAERSDVRRQRRDILERHAWDNFPNEYNALSRMLRLQGGQRDFYGFPEQIDVITETPENACIILALREHDFSKPRESEAYRSELYDLLTATFTRNGNNFYFFEFATTNKYTGLVEGYNKFHSFVSARLYTLIKSMNESAGQKLSVTQKDIDSRMPGFLSAVQENTQAHFFLVTYQVLDRLIKEGYQITPIEEKGLTESNEIGTILHRGNISSMPLQQLRQFLYTFANNTIDRNRRVAEQITSTLTPRILDNRQTNIVVQMGILHDEGQGISNFLPDVLRPISSSVKLASARKDLYGNGPFVKLLRGEDITDEEVEEMRHSLVNPNP